jgi:hypothetical protein
MKKVSSRTASLLVELLLVVLLVEGCAVGPPPPYQGYADRAKIHLNVALNVPDELRKRPDSEDKRYPLKDSLAKNAPILASHTFTGMEEIDNGSQPPSTVDAILTPRVAYVGGTVGSKVIFDIKLEWTLTDPKGDPIWIDTVGGWGYGDGGGKRNEVLKEALYSLLDKTQEAMWHSEAIRRFAKTKYTDVESASAPAAMIANTEVMKLCASLDSYDVEEVKRSLRKLRKMNAAEAVPSILRCMKYGRPDIQRECCQTLAVLGDRNTIPYLEPLLTNPDVRGDAKKAIKKLGGKT